MEGEALLSTLSQLALGLAGFAGIVGAFRRSSNEWILQDFMGLRMILELSFASAFYGLLPSAAFLASNSASTAIQWSSLLLSIFFITHFFFELRRANYYRREGCPPRRPLIHIGILLVPELLLFVVTLANCFWWRAIAIYVYCLIFLLFAASVQFFSLVNPQSNDPRHSKSQTR